jgi:hypothetical protein
LSCNTPYAFIIPESFRFWSYIFLVGCLLIITTLIVEEQVITALDVKNIIRNCGISKVKIIVKGKEAIEYIDKTPPSIAFLDIILADDVSGYTLQKN